MRIMFIISSLNSGGAERVLSTIANSLSKKYEVIIIKTDVDQPFYDLDSNIILESLDFRRMHRNIFNKILNSYVIIKSFRNVIKKHNPDIVISFLDKTNIYALLATRYLKQKIIISERINHEYLKNKFWRFLRRIIYPYTDGMVVLSKYDYNKYSYVQNKRIIFNPLFVNEKTNTVIKKEKIILAVGRLVKDKGFDILLDALSLVKKDLLKGWNVYIIGDGKERKHLEMKSDKLKLNSIVTFLGNKKDIIDYYQRASIFVSTSRAEGFPNALSEALSLGCASIATDCLTGPSELIQDNLNGFLIQVDDVKTISLKIELLIKDEKLRIDFSTKGVELSQQYKTENIVLEWEHYINEISEQ